MSGQAESPTKALVPNDSLHNDQWKLDLQKSITDLCAQVNTLQANLNQMSGPALPTLDNNGPISKEPLADDQWKLTMNQILTELCAKVNNLESELRDLKSQTCAPLNEGTPNTFRFGSTSQPAPPAKRPRPQAPFSSSSKVGNPTKPTPQKTPIPSTSQPLLQPPVPAHLLTKVMGRPKPDKTLHEMDDITPVWLIFWAIFPNGKTPSQSVFEKYWHAQPLLNHHHFLWYLPSKPVSELNRRPPPVKRHAELTWKWQFDKTIDPRSQQHPDATKAALIHYLLTKREARCTHERAPKILARSMDTLLDPLVNSTNAGILQCITDRLQKAYQAKHTTNRLSPNPRIPTGANTQPERVQPGRPHVPTAFPAQPQPSTTDSSTTKNDIEMADINKDQGLVVLTEDEQC
ncbi:hypothetical protein SARC_04014 [Sphaeroforma arctica JP610]|uniref:Uncharacterized protein n=1 Tax=Sphaeroforma arctica JP610 TaxID=667725 RepID=A0A0L0G3W4_9EUKA|nr:hypothetical protein SARC_04014 [Sphaeroforma arctica JP610]KNC83735.1 hypothetical protein SARC_04014 [Sphaeroforma arctica JP610]|eukprot:XP_014157637.1 hypothetical protein SARC_04014 [Sphaeroforma arctica JP610]